MAPLPVEESSSPPGPAEDDFRTERGLALFFILAAAAYLRGRAPHLTTAFMDESIYVVYGRMFLSGHFEAPLATPGHWSFGWYLWPAMAALADRAGGLAAVRELAAALGVAAVAAVYGFASRLFSKPAGLGAALLTSALAPAVWASRIATRDAGSLAFFAFGLWALAVAWAEDEARSWLLATLCFFSAFLCKYLVAIFFPLAVVVSLFKGRRALLCFVLPLSVCCAGYAAAYWDNLAHLLRYGGGYNALRAPDGEWQEVYVYARWDFWLVAFVALPLFSAREWRSRAAVLWGGVAILFAFQWRTRADYDFWKHATYALFLLAPLAAANIVSSGRRFGPVGRPVAGAAALLALAAGTAWLGKPWKPDQFLFWPNVEPILSFFEGRLTPQDTVLTDDTVLRYYLEPPLHQRQITDAMYCRFGDKEGPEAYRDAVRQGAFSYVVFDGGMDESARRMDAAVGALRESYDLVFFTREPVLGKPVEVYARRGASPLPADGKTSISIETPASHSAVNRREIAVEGRASGFEPGWTVCVDVFTDRWHPQGDRISLAPDGRFRQSALLGGEGTQRDWHLVRARLCDSRGAVRASALSYAVSYAGPEGR